MQLWRNLLAFSHYQYTKDEVIENTATAYSELVGALATSGKIDGVSILLEKGFQMSRDVYGLKCAHPNVAYVMSEFGKLYGNQGKRAEAVKMHERSIEMKRDSISRRRSCYATNFSWF